VDLDDIKITEEIHQETIKDVNSLISWVIAIATFLIGLLLVIAYYVYRNRSSGQENQYQGGSPISSAPNTPSTDSENSQNRVKNGVNGNGLAQNGIARNGINHNSNSEKSEDKNFCINLKDMTTNLFNKQRYNAGGTNTSNPSSQTSNFASVNCLGRPIEVGRSTLNSLRRNNEPVPTESPADFRRNSRTSNKIMEDSSNSHNIHSHNLHNSPKKNC
jgi:hypothetical protein